MIQVKLWITGRDPSIPSTRSTGKQPTPPLSRSAVSFVYNDRRKKIIPNKVPTKYAFDHYTPLSRHRVYITSAADVCMAVPLFAGQGWSLK